MNIARNTFVPFTLKQIILSLAIIGSLAVGGMLATPTSAAGTPSISASYDWAPGTVTIDGQSFSPGGTVDISVWRSTGGRVATGSTTAQPGPWVHYTTCGVRTIYCGYINPFAGQFSITLPQSVACSSWSQPVTLVVHARDRVTGRRYQTTLVPYCQY